ncbi:MAG: hypothetical protein ACHRHE_08210 [Tepidisphaerales bacterium]
MIMVVALLLLLALMATAWLSTARSDRMAALANTSSTQIDMLTQGVASLAFSRIVDGVFSSTNGSTVPRPWVYLNDASPAYVNIDFLSVDSAQAGTTLPQNLCRSRNWLASRVPQWDPNHLPPVSPIPPSMFRPFWPAITASLGGRDVSAGMADFVNFSPQVFESPYVAPNAFASGSLSPGEYTNRTKLEVSHVEITAADGSVRSYPAWAINNALYIAADTVGEGVPDAGLFRLPPGEQNGIVYYGAVRIIDNGGAVNVSVANKIEVATDPATWYLDPNFHPNLFPTSVDLYGMLFSGLPNVIPAGVARPWTAANDQLAWLNVYRFGNMVTDYTYDQPARFNPTLSVYDDAGNPRANTNERYNSIHDGLWHQVGTRIDRPGFSQTIGADRQFYRAMSIGDAAAVTRGFTISSPAGSSEVEKRLYPSVNTVVWRWDGTQDVTLYMTTPYAPGELDEWFTDNFWYDNNFYFSGSPNDYYSRRALMVARNGLGQTIPDATSLVQPPATATSGFPGAPDGALALDPAVTGGLPTKVSLNTGNFRELWRAYWYVMADHIENASSLTGDTTPFLNTAGGTLPTSPYFGMAFDPATGAAVAQEHGWRMFRSSLRPSGATGDLLHPSQQLLLRAALAAANTMELRSGPLNSTQTAISDYLNTQTNTNVQVQDVTVTTQGGRSLTAHVYGNKPQPYIGEVYANNDTSVHSQYQPDAASPNDPTKATPQAPFYRNKMGFVAITLHNPHGSAELNGAMDISNWQLIVVDRKGAAPASPQVLFTMPAGTKIQPQAFLVLSNYVDGGDVNNANNPKTYAPGDLTGNDNIPPIPPATLKSYPFPQMVAIANTTDATKDLSYAFDKELILVRPLRTGVILPNVVDWNQAVPVDSFDFTGLKPVPKNPADPATTPKQTGQFGAWVYRRDCTLKTNGTKFSQYRCVYPGRYDASRYDPTKPDNDPRQQGAFKRAFTYVLTFKQPDPNAPGFFTGDPSGDAIWASGVKHPLVGVPSDANLYTDFQATYSPTFSVPIASVDSPGPFGPGKTGNKFQYPFGGFARTLDVMQAPFIGAYVLVDASNNLVEANPVTLDAAFAEDTDLADNEGTAPAGHTEQIGRFVPLKPDDNLSSGIARTDKRWHDYSTDPTNWRYHWAQKTPEFLCVDLPAKDFLPASTAEYALGTIYNNQAGTPVQNLSTSIVANTSGENGVGLEGLININTAPIPVLAAIPFSIRRDQNLVIARAIAKFRDVDDGSGKPHGPFRNIFELYLVDDVRKWEYNNIFLNGAPPRANDGMLIPAPSTAAAYGIRTDFNERYLLLNRISNIVTTRSDSFTVYVLVQGWRNVGTQNPELVAERRLCFIVNRAAIKSGNRKPQITNIPME